MNKRVWLSSLKVCFSGGRSPYCEPKDHFRGTFAHLSFDPLAICLYNDVMCKTRAPLDFHGIWVQLRCNFTQCAQSRLQFKCVCTCNWKHYCHIDAIKIWYSWITIWNTLFFFLLSCSSSVLMVFLLIRNRQFRCQPFFSLQKAEAVNPFKAIPGIYDEEVAGCHGEGAIGEMPFFWGVKLPCVCYCDERSQGWCI